MHHVGQKVKVMEVDLESHCENAQVGQAVHRSVITEKIKRKNEGITGCMCTSKHHVVRSDAF